MLRRLALVVCLGLAWAAPGALAQEELEENPEPDLETREFSRGPGRFEMGVPSDWEVVDEGAGALGGAMLYAADRGAFILVFAVPGGGPGPGDGPRQMVEQMARQAFTDPEATLDSIEDGPTVEVAEVEAATLRFEGTFQEGELSEPGLPEDLEVGEFLVGTADTEEQTVFFLGANRAGAFDEHEPVFQAMLGSFHSTPEQMAQPPVQGQPQPPQAPPPPPDGQPAPGGEAPPEEPALPVRPADARAASLARAIESAERAHRSAEGEWAPNLIALREAGYLDGRGLSAKGTAHGYRFRLRIPDDGGFELDVQPVEPGPDRWFLFLDESGTLRAEEGRPAGPDSPECPFG